MVALDSTNTSPLPEDNRPLLPSHNSQTQVYPNEKSSASPPNDEASITTTATRISPRARARKLKSTFDSLPNSKKILILLGLAYASYNVMRISTHAFGGHHGHHGHRGEQGLQAHGRHERGRHGHASEGDRDGQVVSFNEDNMNDYDNADGEKDPRPHHRHHHGHHRDPHDKSDKENDLDIEVDFDGPPREKHDHKGDGEKGPRRGPGGPGGRRGKGPGPHRGSPEGRHPRGGKGPGSDGREHRDGPPGEGLGPHRGGRGPGEHHHERQGWMDWIMSGGRGHKEGRRGPGDGRDRKHRGGDEDEEGSGREGRHGRGGPGGKGQQGFEREEVSYFPFNHPEMFPPPPPPGLHLAWGGPGSLHNQIDVDHVPPPLPPFFHVSPFAHIIDLTDSPSDSPPDPQPLTTDLVYANAGEPIISIVDDLNIIYAEAEPIEIDLATPYYGFEGVRRIVINHVADAGIVGTVIIKKAAAEQEELEVIEGGEVVMEKRQIKEIIEGVEKIWEFSDSESGSEEESTTEVEEQAADEEAQDDAKKGKDHSPGPPHHHGHHNHTISHHNHTLPHHNHTGPPHHGPDGPRHRGPPGKGGPPGPHHGPKHGPGGPRHRGPPGKGGPPGPHHDRGHGPHHGGPPPPGKGKNGPHHKHDGHKKEHRGPKGPHKKHEGGKHTRSEDAEKTIIKVHTSLSSESDDVDMTLVNLLATPAVQVAQTSRTITLDFTAPDAELEAYAALEPRYHVEIILPADVEEDMIPGLTINGEDVNLIVEDSAVDVHIRKMDVHARSFDASVGDDASGTLNVGRANIELSE